MAISVRKYEDKDLSEMIRIWNEVVEDGVAFPQETPLDKTSGKEFFAAQTYCGVAVTDSGETAGLYILHPNNVGRCGHIANASYAVARSARGMGAGKKLVTDCLAEAKAHGFRILQFNAVVDSNTVARKLYESLGFEQLGVIKGGFRMPNGEYENICPYYITL